MIQSTELTDWKIEAMQQTRELKTTIAQMDEQIVDFKNQVKKMEEAADMAQMEQRSMQDGQAYNLRVIYDLKSEQQRRDAESNKTIDDLKHQLKSLKFMMAQSQRNEAQLNNELRKQLLDCDATQQESDAL